MIQSQLGIQITIDYIMYRLGYMQLQSILSMSQVSHLYNIIVDNITRFQSQLGLQPVQYRDPLMVLCGMKHNHIKLILTLTIDIVIHSLTCNSQIMYSSFQIMMFTVRRRNKTIECTHSITLLSLHSTTIYRYPQKRL